MLLLDQINKHIRNKRLFCDKNGLRLQDKLTIIKIYSLLNDLAYTLIFLVQVQQEY